MQGWTVTFHCVYIATAFSIALKTETSDLRYRVGYCDGECGVESTSGNSRVCFELDQHQLTNGAYLKALLLTAGGMLNLEVKFVLVMCCLIFI